LNSKSSKMVDFNERRYGKVSELSLAGEHRQRMIVSMVGTGVRVLDIGCHDGVIGRKIMDAGNEVVGVDISTKAVALAQAKGLEAYQMDITEDDQLLFDKASFDVVIAGEIIEHIIDTDKFLLKIRDTLKPNGKLVLTTPNIASIGRRILLMLGRNPLTETRLDENAAGHIRYFTKRTLFELLQDNGFKPVRFTSDIVNFNRDGTLHSVLLAKAWPTLGAALIVQATKDP
jgi:2-polyprenyl-3-methyl-5-hydroxy-6-metoxy-1,4-benzoquinol methylase